MVLYACRAAGIQAIGFIGSIADLGEVEAFSTKLVQARALGFRGAVIVHPKFLEAINDCFTPSVEQLDEARRVVEGFEAAYAEGSGAVKVDGKMIDKPVYKRAQALLAMAATN